MYVSGANDIVAGQILVQVLIWVIICIVRMDGARKPKHRPANMVTVGKTCGVKKQN